MGSLVERLSILIDAKTGGAVKEFDKVAASTKDLEAQTGKTGKALQALGLSGKISGDALKAGIAVGAAAAGAALIKFGVDSVKAFSDATSEVRAFRRVAGGTAEDASRLVAAMKVLNIDTGAAAKGFGILSKTIENTPQKLTDIGVAVAKNKDGTVSLAGTLLNVADAYRATKDQAEKNNIALQAFGRGGLALAPILQRGRDGLRELYAEAAKHHEIFSDADLEKGRQFSLATKEMGNAFRGLELEAGKALIPIATGLANATKSAIEFGDKVKGALNNKALGLGLRIGEDIFTAGQAETVRLIVGHLSKEKGAADDAKASTISLSLAADQLGVSTDSLAGKTTAEIDALKEQKKALDGVYSATLASFDATFAYQDALNGAEDAAAKVTEAQKALNDATKAHGASSAEAQAANEALSRALLAQQEQALQTADAAGRMAEQNALAGGAADGTIPKIDAQIAELERQKGQVDGRNIPAIQAMIDKLNAIKRQYPTSITVDTSSAEAKVSHLQGAITRVLALTAGGAPGAKKQSAIDYQAANVPGNASGGTINPGGWSWVGEQGPELIRAGMSGASVVPNGASMRAVGGGAVNVNIYMPPGSDGEDVVSAIRRYERRNGTAWRN